MNPSQFLPVILLALCSVNASTALAVSFGQSDTFENGTVQGWSVGPGGHSSPPTNIATGGPSGADDNYLRATALGGGGAGSRLAFFNSMQWSGNYLAAGITAISMHVNNFGPNEAHLRLRFLGFSGGPTNDVAITNAIVVPPGSGWSLITFTIDPASLVTLQGSATGALSNATELRIFHNPAATYPPQPTGPPAINVQLGFDNIRAIPEASSIALISIGALALAALTRKCSARKGA
jgi:hypothetical protein